MKPRVRDYIDLFLILRKEKFNLKDLIINTKAKFDWDIDRINLSSQFIRVKEIGSLKEIPKMLISFDQKEMTEFFLSSAKNLEKDIFK